MSRPAPARPTILYFHGNAGNISGRAKRFKQVVDSGFGLLAMSYRGYAGSGGSPSEAALLLRRARDLRLAGGEAPDIVVYGESLGTAVATDVAARRQGRALVLEAPFTAALDIAAATYPWVPASLLMRDPFLSREHILRRGRAGPHRSRHGGQVIPVEMGRQLFELAHEPKSLAIIDGATHSDLWDHGLWPIVLVSADGGSDGGAVTRSDRTDRSCNPPSSS